MTTADLGRADAEQEPGLHPGHAVLLASCLPLFLGALLSDWAYHATREVQWINFAAWLVPGALVFVGIALAWAIVDHVRYRGRNGLRRRLYVGVLAATFVVGMFAALEHAKDAFATMPGGLILSLLAFVLALAAVWLGFSRRSIGARR